MVKKIGIILIIIGAVCSCGRLYERIKFESRNRKVDILTGSDEHSADLKACVLEEYTLKEWLARSWAGKWQPPMDYPFKDYSTDTVTLIFHDAMLYKKACDVMKIKLPDIDTVEINNSFYIRLKDIDWEDLKEMGMGVVDECNHKHKRVYIRPVNDKWVNAAYTNWFFNSISADSVIFKGTEVMGYPENLNAVKDRIKGKKMKVFLIEFAAQKGMTELARGLKIARLHSVPPDLSGQEVISRVSRAVRERNIRAIYIDKPEPGMLKAIRQNLEENGFSLGNPEGFNTVERKNWKLIFGMFSIVMAVTGLFLMHNKPELYPASIIMVLGVVLIPNISLQVLSMLCAVCFPLAATGIAIRDDCSFIKGIVIYFVFSILAGILIGSAAGEPAFFVKLEQLRGIKVSLLLPIVLSVFIIYSPLSFYMKESVKWKELILLMVMFGIAGLYILRSTNNPVGAVSVSELKLRLLLENIFYVRPRFKEFLFGHPLLIAGLYFLKNKNRGFKYTRILILLGLIGQVSIINTFMHIHTPFAVSVLRTFWGICLGAASGAVLIVLLSKWQDLKK